MEKKNHILLMMIFCVFFWGSLFPIAKLLLVNMSGLSLAICRFIIAVLCLGLFMQLRRIKFPSLTFCQWFITVLTGGVGIGGFNYAFFNGLLQTSSTNGALIMALSPVMTGLLSALFEGRWLEKKQSLSLVIALSGVALVLTKVIDHYRTSLTSIRFI